jgi:hypothetical protein
MTGWQITASPGATLVTADPTCWTHPAFSCPRVMGSRWDRSPKSICLPFAILSVHFDVPDHSADGVDLARLPDVVQDSGRGHLHLHLDLVGREHVDALPFFDP